jgi:formylglycine-generating enzyme required for sulfatase activity
MVNIFHRKFPVKHAGQDGYAVIAPVAQFPANGYGLYDIIGNVMEWTNDWYDGDYYPLMPKQNPKGPATGRYKSLRGASWADNAAEERRQQQAYDGV